MKTTFLIMLVLICRVSFVFGQTMTKKEIYTNWTDSNKSITEKEVLSNTTQQTLSRNKDFDSAIKKLLKENIDTFCFFKIFLIGNLKKNNLSNYEYYLFWLYNGKFFVQKFTEKMASEKLIIDESHLINFYIENEERMKQDYIMPPIYSGKRKGTKIEYESAIQFHEKNYIVFCQLGKKFKSIQLGQSYFKDEKSLFYLDNISTFSFHWFTIAEAEVKLLKGRFPD